MNPLSSKKLLLSKWTAVHPRAKEKHFLVIRLIKPEPPQDRIEYVEIEAVHSRRACRIAWRDLRDASVWCQGWV